MSNNPAELEKTESREISIFNFELDFNVRMVTIGEEPFFVAKDVCDVLGIINPSDAISNLMSNYESIGVDTKGIVSIYTLLTTGGMQEMTVVSEPVLYDLIFQSRKHNALKFKYWIVSEVLPSIRKTGAYTLQKALDENKSLSKNIKEIKILLNETNVYVDENRSLNRRIKELKALLSKADKSIEKNNLCNDNLKKDYNDIVKETKTQNDEIKKLNSIIKTQSSKIESCEKVIEKHKNRDDFAKDLSMKCLEKMQEYLNCNALKHVTAGRVFRR